MRSSWKGLYISSDIFFKIIKTRNKKLISKLKVNDFKILIKNTRGIRNSTIIPEMKFFTIELPYGVLGNVRVKVRKKGKKMVRFKPHIKLYISNDNFCNLKLGEFAPTRNFLKHTTKTKKNK